MKSIQALRFLAAFSTMFLQTSKAHNDAHEHARRLVPSVPLNPPYAPLVWGNLNILHTTDTHGWLLGHQVKQPVEENYSGDFGDFFSFVAHMQELALEKDVDLLLVDSGDVHDGTGLSDGYPAGGIDAHDSNQFIKALPYDILAIGNHELYIYNNTLDMYTDFAPFWKGKYLSSNVNITVEIEGKNVSVPVGSRYRKFSTRKGRKVTAFGVLYDFSGNDMGTYVQYVAEMVKESWFLEAIQEAPDFFLLVGHMPVSKDNWPLVFDAIRAVHKYTPILIFGGHTHIRDCNQLDGRSMSLESGRYMETVGWMSVNLTESNSDKNLSFSRRYMDNNLVTYEYHTKTNGFTFNTLEGIALSFGLQGLANWFDLQELYGTLPQDYYVSQAEYLSNNSIYTLLREAMPYSLAVNNSRGANPKIVCTNTGEVRYDVFEGDFTKNDAITALPFKDAFVYAPNVPASLASQVENALNGVSAPEKRGLAEREAYLFARGSVQKRYEEWLREMSRRHHGFEKRVAENLTYGYKTTDSCPGVGDDTPHLPLESYYYPDYTCSQLPANVTGDEPVDLVTINYILSDMIEALKKIQNTTTYTEESFFPYTTMTADQILPVYVSAISG